MSLKTPIAATLRSLIGLPADNTARNTYDCRGIDIGMITARVINDFSPPGAPIQFNVYVAHTTGTTPAAPTPGLPGEEDSDTGWKRVMTRAGDTVSNSSYRFVYNFSPEVNHIMVEFTGHTTNTVHVEAHLSAASYD